MLQHQTCMAKTSKLWKSNHVLNNAKWPGAAGQVWNQSKHAGGCKNSVALTDDKLNTLVFDEASKRVLRKLWLKRRIVRSELTIEPKHALKIFWLNCAHYV